MPKSLKVEVIADNSGTWSSNRLRWPLDKRTEAEEYAIDLMWRWTAVREWRVVESDEEPNR